MQLQLTALQVQGKRVNYIFHISIISLPGDSSSSPWERSIWIKVSRQWFKNFLLSRRRLTVSLRVMVQIGKLRLSWYIHEMMQKFSVPLTNLKLLQHFSSQSLWLAPRFFTVFESTDLGPTKNICAVKEVHNAFKGMTALKGHIIIYPAPGLRGHFASFLVRGGRSVSRNLYVKIASYIQNGWHETPM